MSVTETLDAGFPRRAEKSAAAFRTISEVAEELDVPQHVLRFWESKFAQIRPLKRGGGRRYYRPEDVGLLRRIRQLLYQEGYTIKGVQRLLREGPQTLRSTAAARRAEKPAPATLPEKPAQAVLPDSPAEPDAGPQVDSRAFLASIRDDLVELRRLLIS